MRLVGLSGILEFQNSVLRKVGHIRHFHIVFLIPKHDDDDFNVCLNLEKKLFDEVLFEWRRNYGTWRKPDYRSLCTYVRKYVHGRLRSNFDLHYVNPSLSSGGVADVAFYVLKYMMKPSDRSTRLQQALRLNLPEDEYEDIWSLVKCRHFESERFGLGVSEKCTIPEPIYSHLRHGLDLSRSQKDDPYPSYFSIIDGSKHPLARYYKSQGDVYTMQDFLDFFYASSQSADNIIIPDYDHYSQVFKLEDDFKKKVDVVEFAQTANELDDLFDFDDSLFL